MGLGGLFRQWISGKLEQRAQNTEVQAEYNREWQKQRKIHAKELARLEYESKLEMRKLETARQIEDARAERTRMATPHGQQEQSPANPARIGHVDFSIPPIFRPQNKRN